MSTPRTNLNDVLARKQRQMDNNAITNNGTGDGVRTPGLFKLARPLTESSTTSRHHQSLNMPGVKQSQTNNLPSHAGNASPSSSSSYFDSNVRQVGSRLQPNHLMTPNSAVGSPLFMDGKGKGKENTPVGSVSTMGKPSKFASWSNERLAEEIVKIMEEKDALKDRKMGILMGRYQAEEEDDDFIDENIEFKTKKINVLKAEMTARRQSPAVNLPAARLQAPQSSGSTSYSIAQHDYPTPDTIGSGRPRTILGEWTERRPKGLSSDDSEPLPIPQSRSHGFLQLSEAPQAGPSRPRRAPSPPPEYDDYDIAMAEEGFPEEADINEMLIPPSSPPPRAITPPPRSSRNKHLQPQPPSKSAAIAEIQDLAAEEIFSSPIHSTSNLPPRVEASQARSAIGGPGPSSSARKPLPVQVAQQRTIVVEKTYPWTKEVETKLRQMFKLPNFRKHQKEAINETMAGKDVFVLMPTGGGKSLTYQLPAVCQMGRTRGVTFVVSPLISLINDQSRHLCRLNIPAIAYTGDMTQKDKNDAHEELNRPEPYTRVVYVTPEMLTMGGHIKSILRNLLRRNRLARFVIDEAHCVSQWGHDFRADYLRLGDLRKDYPGVPIMALTATAQNKVEEDIIRSLGIKGCSVLRQSFNRPNLHYEVRPKTKKVIDEIVAFVRTQGEQASGIIYCNSRDGCENLAKDLRDHHELEAHHYHAGMSKGDRRKIQEGWQEHHFEIIVATIAFGMGIDKPDVRFVIHHSLPRSLEGYYQETGRAGRDGKPSTCILYYTFGDGKRVLNQIDQDQNLSRDQKERQKASMNEVLRYCSNKADCRRSQVLSFFNETFAPIDCNQGCDVCLGRDGNVFTTEDVTADAVNVIKLVQAFGRDDKITIINAAECFKGVRGSSGKGLDNNPHFGVGKEWSRQEGERLIQTLVIEGALEEFCVASAAGWTNAYLQLGKQARSYLNGSKRLNMDFRQASPRKKTTAKNSAPKRQGSKTQVQIDSFAQKVSNPIARKRSHQQILAEVAEFDDSPWGDTDEEYRPEDEGDPIQIDDSATEKEDGDDGLPLMIKKRKTARKEIGTAIIPKPGHAQIKGVNRTKQRPIEVDRDDTASPVEACLKALEKMRDSVIAKNKNAPRIDDGTLQYIAATMPTNEKDLKSVEGLTSAHIRTYATRIMGICVKLRPAFHIQNPQVAPLATVSARSASNSSNSGAVMSRIQRYAFDPKSKSAATCSAKASSSTSTTPLRQATTLASSLSGTKTLNGQLTLTSRLGGLRPVLIPQNPAHGNTRKDKF
ncbi:uncharacterized protein IL334_000956 [Kwoniella shivajii]|uniref:DNA 3'-5' helicase n=1 Tax=Kwoniella shivajii TaxID=564305 RepID=A0ABZ1CQL4_9TREE|nr:hypothetical protein IL334_000956 [Kwoniella shivajii]